MEIKATQSRPLIIPEPRWVIYIAETCHWNNIHKLRFEIRPLLELRDIYADTKEKKKGRGEGVQLTWFPGPQISLGGID